MFQYNDHISYEGCFRGGRGLLDQGESAMECGKGATVFYGGVSGSYLFGGIRDGNLRIRY